MEAFRNDLNTNNKSTNKQLDNLTKEERNSLNTFINRDDIIILKADKGGAVVIMNTKDYIEEANRQLNNTDFYTTVDMDPTQAHAELINTSIRNFVKEKLITEKSGKALSVENPKTPRFYMLPKIHKPNNPGRPVVNSINSPSSNISQYVDFYLQPIVQSLKAYIKDTTDFINKIDGITELPVESILVTMDVRSLYTNIPHREGINAVAKALENIKGTQISTRVIIKLLSLILHLNNFSFNGKHYQQTQGCTMGSKCSPSYANLFMGDFEEKFIYPKIKNKSACYYRFIDDIFMIWTGTKEELLRFFEDINLQHQSIKFDYSYSTSEISFLDTVVLKIN